MASLVDEKNTIKIVDVGASGGLDPRWEGIGNIEPILFEPDPREYPRLKKSVPSNFIVLNAALSDKKEDLKFHLCKKQQVSSCFEPNRELLDQFPDSERFNVEKIESMSADTLDSQLSTNNIKNVDFMKLDTQGTELAILKGSKETLPSVIGVEIEVEFAEMYKKQPLFSEVDEFLVKEGFTLFDLKRYFWKREIPECFNHSGKGQLIFGDALYLRTPDKLIEQGIDAAKAARACQLYVSYGYYDLALSLLSRAKTKKIITETSYQKQYRDIKKSIQVSPTPNFVGKTKVYSALKKLSNVFTPTSWYFGTDQYLGNK